MNKFYFVSVLILSLNIYAEDGFDDDGFDDENIEVVLVSQDSVQGELYGSINFEAHQNISNNKNLSSSKILVDLLGDYKFENGAKLSANLKSYYDFVYQLENLTVPKGYKSEIELNELNIELEILPNLDFKTGRQVVVWGKSDSIRITDILNPLDNRKPGLVDIKNLRLGRTMSKLDYYVDNLNYSIIALHENRFSKNPKSGSDFKSATDLNEIHPDDSFENTDIAISLTGAFEGYDIGVYYANTYIDKPYLFTGVSNVLKYDNKSNMFGSAFNLVDGSFLFKAEVAHFDNINYNGTADAKSRTDVLLGVEYNGITDGSIGYEVAIRKIHDYEADIYLNNNYTVESQYQQVFRFSQSYLNQTLNLTSVLSAFGNHAQDGGSARVELDYALDDELTISGGVIDYLAGDNPAINAFKDNDRIFAKVTHSF